jgi:hypothetical protein
MLDVRFTDLLHSETERASRTICRLPPLVGVGRLMSLSCRSLYFEGRSAKRTRWGLVSIPLLLSVEVALIYRGQVITPAEAVFTQDVPEPEVCDVVSEKADFKTPLVSRVPVELRALIIVLTSSSFAIYARFRQ